MSHSPKRPFVIAYFVTKGLAACNQPSRFGYSSSHLNATHAATKRLLALEFVGAAVYSPIGDCLVTLTRTSNQLTFTGLLP